MNSHDFPVSHCPSSVPSSASTTALSLPVVTRVREGQPGGVDKRVGKDKHKESRHHPRVAFDDGDGVPGPAGASGLLHSTKARRVCKGSLGNWPTPFFKWSHDRNPEPGNSTVACRGVANVTFIKLSSC